MMLDKENLVSDAQQVVGAAGNYLSSNTIDLRAPGTMIVGGSPNQDPGMGNPVPWFCRVTSGFAGGTSVEAQLVQADNAALTTNLEVLATTGAIPVAQLIAGYSFKIGYLPHGINKRFIGMRYVTVGVFAAAGSDECRVSAGVRLNT